MLKTILIAVALTFSVVVSAGPEDAQVTALVSQPGTMEVRDDVCRWCWRWGGRR